MDLLAQTTPHVLHHAIVIRLAKQVRQQESGHIHALIRIGVTVVLLDALTRDPEYLARHVGEETRLFVFHAAAADLREEFLGQDVRHDHLALALGRPAADVL